MSAATRYPLVSRFRHRNFGLIPRAILTIEVLRDLTFLLGCSKSLTIFFISMLIFDIRILGESLTLKQV